MIIVNPPYPIQNCFHEDEYEVDPSQAFDVISNENLRYVIQISKLAYKSRMNPEFDTGSGLTFILPDQKIISVLVPSGAIEVFGITDTEIHVSSDTISTQIIKMLYTSTIDRYISDEDANELEILFIKWRLKSYVALCKLIPLIRTKTEIGLGEFLGGC
jgi:hypothetical protein